MNETRTTTHTWTSRSWTPSQNRYATTGRGNGWTTSSHDDTDRSRLPGPTRCRESTERTR